VLSADALELGLGDGVVAAEAIPVTPIPAPSANAPAAMPSVILFVRDMLRLLDPPYETALCGRTAGLHRPSHKDAAPR
jgi:hypothetical protein